MAPTVYHQHNPSGHVPGFSVLPAEKHTGVSARRQDTALHFGFDEIEKTSPSLGKVISLVRKISGSDIPVLLTGESGVGKEVFARAIHYESRRRDMAFVPVNCGALPESLVESALFGHEKGAFTGAVARVAGKCREADGGVLFLDEVGELKPEAQVKLLRMLQQGEIEPVGSGRPVKVNVRVICATNRNLEQMVAKERFREDLYYRIRGLPLHIPPLRERRGDIAIIAPALLHQIVHAERLGSKALADDAMECLASYDWPGNVRELQHVLHRASLLAETDVIGGSDIAPWIQQARGASGECADDSSVITLEGIDGVPKTLEQIEREVIGAALRRYRSHVGRTAAALGISQSTLYKKIGR